MKKFSFYIVLCFMALLSCTEDKMPGNMVFGTPSSSKSIESDAISANVSSLSFTAEGGSENVIITSNFSWEVISKPSWITLSKTSGPIGTTSVTVTAEATNSSSSRTGTIAFGTSSITVSISLSQSAVLNNVTSAIQLDAGGTSPTYNTGHSLLLKNDGTLWTWGANSSGQLGDGTSEDKYKPIFVMNNVKKVAAGVSHTLALKNDGSLWGWGHDGYGELGTDSRFPKRQPIEIMNDVSEIAAGHYFSLAVKNDGTLWAWGQNSAGQLGTGTTTDIEFANYNPTYIMDNVLQVAAGWLHSLAIKKDGTLWAWGSNSEGQIGDGTDENRLRPVKIMDGAKTIVAGGRYSLVIKSDNTLWGWGYNSNGNLGVGPTGFSTYSNPTPCKIAENVIQVAAGDAHTLVLKEDGTLWVCGLNGSGQLGVGIPSSDDEKSVNRELIKLMSNVKIVAASGGFSLAVKNDGTLWGWGDNRYGQLGNGTVSDAVSLPVQCFSISSLK